MRIVFKLIKWTFFIILLAISAIVVLPWLPVAKDQIGKGAFADYIAENTQTIDFDAQGLGVAFPDDVYGPGLILLSEIHGYAMPQDLDLGIVTHLVDAGAAPVYLAEMDPAQAIIVNDYLVSGDDTMLRQVFDRWAEKKLQWANKEFFAKIEKIRALNAANRDRHQVWFVGVDQIHDDGMAGQVAAQPRVAIAPGFGSAIEANAINQVLLAEGLARDAEAGRYTHILENIQRVMAVPGSADQTFYGLWGLFHGSEVPINGGRPLAHRLNAEGGAFADRVTTITTLCLTKCFNMMPAYSVPGPMQGKNGEDYVYLPMTYEQPYLWRVRGAGELMTALGDASAVMIALDGEGTPYHKGPRLVGSSGYLSMMQRFEYDGAAADAHDYIIPMQNSAGLTPWAGSVYDITGAAGNAD